MQGHDVDDSCVHVHVCVWGGWWQGIWSCGRTGLKNAFRSLEVAGPGSGRRRREAADSHRSLLGGGAVYAGRMAAGELGGQQWPHWR